jgi:hypothetical protein
MVLRQPGAPEYSDAEIDAFLATPQGHQIANMMRYTAIGTGEDVRAFLTEFAESVGADELIVAHHADDLASRLRSVELTALAMGIARESVEA